MAKIGIIGGGISGISIAKLLHDNNQVIVYEKEHTLGGLIKCDRVHDCLFHKVGGHVFNANNTKVFDWFWKHFDRDREFNKVKRNAKILINNKIIGYPIENFIYTLDESQVELIIAELLELQKKISILPLEYEHFEAFLKNSFGDTLYEIYFKPYNKKIWNVDLSTVSMEWLEGKLPMPNFQEILKNNILRKEEKNMVHSSFYYPKNEGSQFIIDRLKENLVIKKGIEIGNIRKINGSFLLNDNETFDKIIYCGNLMKLPNYINVLLIEGGIDINCLHSLRFNGTSNIICETDENDLSWLYIPDNFTKAHRIIYTGNFSSSNNRGSSRKTCVVEFSGKVEYDIMKEELKKLPGNLTPLAYNYEPYSYVIQDENTRALINRVKKVLEPHGIYLLGRFAEWEYYNMDKAIEAAFKLSYEFS